jgi:hypothetical protein
MPRLSTKETTMLHITIRGSEIPVLGLLVASLIVLPGLITFGYLLLFCSESLALGYNRNVSSKESILSLDYCMLTSLWEAILPKVTTNLQYIHRTTSFFIYTHSWALKRFIISLLLVAGYIWLAGCLAAWLRYELGLLRTGRYIPLLQLKIQVKCRRFYPMRWRLILNKIIYLRSPTPSNPSPRTKPN